MVNILDTNHSQARSSEGPAAITARPLIPRAAAVAPTPAPGRQTAASVSNDLRSQDVSHSAGAFDGSVMFSRAMNAGIHDVEHAADIVDR